MDTLAGRGWNVVDLARTCIDDLGDDGAIDIAARADIGPGDLARVDAILEQQRHRHLMQLRAQRTDANGLTLEIGNRLDVGISAEDTLLTVTDRTIDQFDLRSTGN